MKVASTDVLQTAVQGLHKASEKAAGAAERIVTGPVEAEDVVDLKTAEIEFKANAKVVKTAEELQDRLLDILT